eukprot:s2607_g6.t1
MHRIRSRHATSPVAVLWCHPLKRDTLRHRPFLPRAEQRISHHGSGRCFHFCITNCGREVETNESSEGKRELLSHAGLGSNTLPGWLVLIVLFVPYSLNLACSVMSLRLGNTLSDFLEEEDLNCGLASDDRLAEQAEQVSGQDRCCVCMDQRKDSVITPCGHRAVCIVCANVLKGRGRQCPVCRSPITGVVRVFDS